ncbi:MAG: TetR/AcrR family transcriptional regulator [Aeromicrobium sp.]|uniref:TetR/AcrR family transcriptional regulator n=1 Tax=Aeromicrobium sp. TaxID=1871063 RepID=UPI0039E51341
MDHSPPGLRKTPQQQRSRAMVERIVAAGRRVLIEQGYERATTNRVAEAAGISPGSLYQYFPNKEAVLQAVVERYSAEIAEELAAVVTDRLDLPPEELIRASYESLLDLLGEHREYVRLMARELPRARVAPHIEAMERRVGELVTAYLTVARPTRRVRPATSAWLLVRMVEFLSVQYVLEEPDVGRGEFVEELTRLTLAHLAPAD